MPIRRLDCREHRLHVLHKTRGVVPVQHVLRMLHESDFASPAATTTVIAIARRTARDLVSSLDTTALPRRSLGTPQLQTLHA